MEVFIATLVFVFHSAILIYFFLTQIFDKSSMSITANILDFILKFLVYQKVNTNIKWHAKSGINILFKKLYQFKICECFFALDCIDLL